MSRRTDLAALETGVLARDRLALARAITLVESTRAADQAAAEELLGRLLPRTGGAMRVGISGAPGAGKSTFIEALGAHLTASGRRVAVLAVDPTSTVSGGSILGDKTRMTRLAADPAAFVRPSPSGATAFGATLGGVARRTREALLLCEAAGYDVVLVETVGVGQSEAAVADMVDFFLLLVMPGAGDELQGIKRGVVELADGIVVTKADGENVSRAREAQAHLEAALRLLRPGAPDGASVVRTCSAHTGAGIAEAWALVAEQVEAARASGALDARRRAQAVAWIDRIVDDLLQARFLADPAVAAALPALREQVAAGRLAPGAAARRLVARDGATDAESRRP